MKPLKNCPWCQAPIIKKTIPEELNCLKYDNCSARCKVDYFQYYKSSYEEDVEYIAFNTSNEKYHLYSYFDAPSWSGVSYKDMTHIHITADLKKNGTSMPLLRIKNFQIDLSNLEKLEEKISLYVLFS